MDHVHARIALPKKNEELKIISEQFKNTKSIWIPFLENKNKSEFESKISFIYVYNLDLEQDYIFGINHYDIPKLDLEEIVKFFGQTHKIILNKSYLNIFDQKYCIDASLVCWYNNNEDFKFNDLVDTSRLSLYYKMYKLLDITNYIPIMIYLDIAREYRNQIILELQKFQRDESFKNYNQLVITELNRIASSGIYIDKDIMFDRFNKVYRSDIVYTKFNPYTRTGRPSSHFDNINYSALNKSDGSREVLKSRFKENGFLLELDYDSCHVRLVGNLVGYKFPKDNIHIYFGKKYFETDELTEEQYEKSKALTFKELYGETTITEIQYFNEVKEFKKDLFLKYRKNGYIETPIFKRKILKRYYDGDVKRMNQNKLFNYLVQSYETEYNVLIMKKLNDFLEMNNKQTKLILYTYDSFLFDFCRTDGRETMEDLITIANYEIPVKIKIGKNYNQMKEV